MIAPLIPRPEPRGQPPVWTPRKILNAIVSVLRGGIAWRLIPKDLPPRSTTFGSFSRWRDAGLFGRINNHLALADRARVGREASPSAAVLDSQSVKTTESGGPRGYDAGKKVKARKRQALVDTNGRALVLDPQPANAQDRDGAVPVLRLSRRSFPFITKAFADAGCDEDDVGCKSGLVRAAGAMRARVAGFPSRELPDILAEAGCLASLYPLPEAEEQVRESINGYACLDEITLALAVEMMKLAEGTRWA